MRIIDGHANFGASLRDTTRRGLIAHLAQRAGVRLPPDEDIAPGPPLMARINHNRWIADCPDCRGAEFVWPDDPRMMCASCWNAMVAGRWRQVILPPNAAYIERILLARPMPQTRNWDPGDSPAKLRAENRARGLPEGV